MYWKRAATEGANYTVTGMSGGCAGFITAYSGGLLVGNPVHAAASRANIATVLPFGQNLHGVDSITTTQPNLLVILAEASAVNTQYSSWGTSQTAATLSGRDLDLDAMLERADGGTTGLRVGAGDAIKIIPGATGEFHPTQVLSDNVGLVAAFLPETVAGSGGTRYYFSSKTAPGIFNTKPHGVWNATLYDPTLSKYGVYTKLLSQVKTDCGRLLNSAIYSNQQGDWDIILHRWMTPPLEAQTVTGTMNFAMAVRAAWDDIVLGYTGASVVHYKVHVYVTKGQTTDVRSVLMDQYVDSIAIPTSPTGQTWATMNGSPALTSGSVLAGDSVIVEVGFRIVSSPTPVPHYPPDEWTEILYQSEGAGRAGNPASARTGVPGQDASAGGTDLTQTPFVDFSHTFVEQAAVVTRPPNDTPATATAIAALPFSDDLDTRDSSANMRAVWYRVVADRTGPLLIHAFGSNYFVRFNIFTGPADALVSVLAGAVGSSARMSPQRCATAYVLNAVEGTPYHVSAYVVSAAFHAPAAAGRLRIGVSVLDQTPQTGDLYIPSTHLMAWRDGQITNLTVDWSGYNKTGIVIDYTRRPLVSLKTSQGIHTGERIYMGLHNFELVEITDLRDLNRGGPEIDFIGDPVNDNANTSCLVMDSKGRIYISWWGNGFLYVNGELPLPAFENTVSSPESRAYLRRIDATHADFQSGAPFIAETLPWASDKMAPHHMVLSEDETIMFYTSGPWYVGSDWFSPAVGLKVQRYDVVNNVQLADFATLVSDASDHPGVRGLTIIPTFAGGGLLVCNGARIDQLSATGTFVKSFVPTPQEDAQLLGDVKMLPDGKRFWVFSIDSGDLFQLDLETGAQLQHVVTGLTGGASAQMAIYQTNSPFAPPPAVPVVTENVRLMRWLRQAPHLSREQMWNYFHVFQLDMETGVGLPTGQGIDPQVMLQWSDDGGHTWSPEIWVSAGPIGAYKWRAIWRRLGRSRDRIFRVAGTDPVKIALIDAYLNTSPGAH